MKETSGWQTHHGRLNAKLLTRIKKRRKMRVLLLILIFSWNGFMATVVLIPETIYGILKTALSHTLLQDSE